MDTERSGEVSDVSETPQQEEAVMEKEVVSKLTTPEEFTEPENPPAADEDHEQPAVNGHSTEETKSRETDELIVTESETVSEEKAEMEVEEPDVVTKPDESSENNSDPVGALDVEPEKIQPVPENIPEPLPVQTPLADAASVPAPDELPKSVPEAEPPAQMLHEPVEPPQLVDKQPLDREEEVSEKVEAEAESKPTMDTGAEEEAARESGDAAKEDAAKADGSSEKTTEAVALKEEEVVESGNVKIAEEEKEAEKAAASDTAAAAEPVAESEPEKETVPETGSLSFALLEQEQTRDALRTSRTLVVLRGLPGSGKSFLARAIADAYKDQCTIISADDYGIKPESPESCADGYKALDEAVVACCAASSAASSALIVVDDTNHTQDRLARMGEVANEHHLVVVFLEPRTEWSRDVAQLSKKTRRGLEEAQMKAMHGQLEEMSLPLFFGWFLLSSVQEKVRCTAMDFLKTLDTLEAFKKHSAECGFIFGFVGLMISTGLLWFNLARCFLVFTVTGKADKDVDLEQYFEAIGALHCTTKFCNYGKAEGAKEYVQKQVRNQLYKHVRG